MSDEAEIRAILTGLDEAVLEPEDMYEAINRAWLNSKVVAQIYTPSPLWSRLSGK